MRSLSSKLARRTANSLRAAYTTHSQLPEEHRMIYEMCRKFADEELAPNAHTWDKKHEFPKEAITHLVSISILSKISLTSNDRGA